MSVPQHVAKINMNRIFVTSDTHFGHQNIIRYANRPFADWRGMGESLIERWNKAVQPEDTVWFLGDFAMGPGATPQYVESVLNRLNGRIEVILGNHDMPSKYSKGLLDLVLEKHFEERIRILDNQIHEVKIDGQHFVMGHYPLEDWNGRSKGSVHLHGHTHNQFIRGDDNPFTKQPHGRFDIGVDMYGGPVQITGDLRYLYSSNGWEM